MGFTLAYITLNHHPLSISDSSLHLSLYLSLSPYLCPQVTRQVAQCKCAKRFQVEQIGENKYRVSLQQTPTWCQQHRAVLQSRKFHMVFSPPLTDAVDHSYF